MTATGPIGWGLGCTRVAKERGGPELSKDGVPAWASQYEIKGWPAQHKNIQNPGPSPNVLHGPEHGARGSPLSVGPGRQRASQKGKQTSLALAMGKRREMLLKRQVSAVKAGLGPQMGRDRSIPTVALITDGLCP